MTSSRTAPASRCRWSNSRRQTPDLLEPAIVKPEVLKQDKYVPLTKEQFRDRFSARYYDPAFDAVKPELERIFEIAWDGYIRYRKSPRTQAAGPGFANPEQKLAVEW